MYTPGRSQGASIISGLRYRDAVVAIDWFVRAPGFEQHAVTPAKTGKSSMPSSFSATH